MIKPQHYVAKNLMWTNDIMDHIQVLKPDSKDLLYDPVRKIIEKALNPQTKGMMGCFSAQIIKKLTVDLSKSLTGFLLVQFNSIMKTQLKSIKQVFQSIHLLVNQIPSHSNKLIDKIDRITKKSYCVQTEPEILSIVSVASIGVQTVNAKISNKSIVISNNFKVKTEPVLDNNQITDRQFEMQSIAQKQSRLFFQTNPQRKRNSSNSDLSTKSYGVKKWSVDKFNILKTSAEQKVKRVVTPSYYPGKSNSRAKFYFDKHHQRRFSMRDTLVIIQ